MWIKITDSNTEPLLDGQVYRNAVSFQEWPDEFRNMTDTPTESNAYV